MPREVVIMYAVALVFGAVGLVLLLRLRSAASEARVYAYRITGVMAASGAAALAISATYLWTWSSSA